MHNQLDIMQITTGYVESYIELFTFIQGKNMSNDDYFSQFKVLLESI